MISVKNDIYREKLIALLTGLECENIPKLVKEETPEVLEKIGKEIIRRGKIMTNFFQENEYADSYMIDEKIY
jgi:hypothetical protein